MNSVLFHYFIDENNSLLFDIPINRVEPRQQSKCELHSFLLIVWITFWITHMQTYSGRGAQWKVSFAIFGC